MFAEFYVCKLQKHDRERRRFVHSSLQSAEEDRARQRKRWEDYIREWTGLEFGKFKTAVENREKWRKLVAKSSVVAERPSRLRD